MLLYMTGPCLSIKKNWCPATGLPLIGSNEAIKIKKNNDNKKNTSRNSREMSQISSGDKYEKLK